MTYRAGWLSGNALGLYSGDDWFESQPRHRLQWLMFLVVLSVPPRKSRVRTLSRPRPLPSKPFSSFNNCPNIWRFTFWDTRYPKITKKDPQQYASQPIQICTKWVHLLWFLTSIHSEGQDSNFALRFCNDIINYNEATKYRAFYKILNCVFTRK
jgi:hypothetical protein